MIALYEVDRLVRGLRTRHHIADTIYLKLSAQATSTGTGSTSIWDHGRNVWRECGQKRDGEDGYDQHHKHVHVFPRILLFERTPHDDQMCAAVYINAWKSTRLFSRRRRGWKMWCIVLYFITATSENMWWTCLIILCVHRLFTWGFIFITQCGWDTVFARKPVLIFKEHSHI